MPFIDWGRVAASLFALDLPVVSDTEYLDCALLDSPHAVDRPESRKRKQGTDELDSPTAMWRRRTDSHVCVS
eukprot:CAMPEP_0114564020 /NCGR_PEP_ID=MMETSP0114-20121206/13460_1 /TAXON_ID=31324 /ORGANISM="Goniomonas sp, Strain m" /LENGTH=71 /DNA_ID=CAMNT_0001749985 /DNA_START=31 /DNA_END=246 /DNA_ORIENTATION=+